MLPNLLLVFLRRLGVAKGVVLVVGVDEVVDDSTRLR
jgi:hypothetical protein